MQKARLWHYIHALHEQARRSLDSNMVGGYSKSCITTQKCKSCPSPKFRYANSRNAAEQVKLEEAEKAGFLPK